MFRCIAAITYVIHISGFLLLVLGQDNGKPMLFGSSLLVPSAMTASFVHIKSRSNGFNTSRRSNLFWIYGLLSICGLIILTGIRNDDKFLQVRTVLSH